MILSASRCGLLFLATFASGAEQDPLKDHAMHVSEMICGPRCVHYVLEYYGVNEDLIDLVKEVQWPDLESGASFAAIEKALRGRGVHTCALRIDPKARLPWDYPIVLHLKARSDIGHYVVLLPTEGDGVPSLWMGLGCIEEVPWERLARELSGTVLLTSPTAITAPERAVQSPTNWLALGLIVVVLLALGATFHRLRSTAKSSVHGVN